MYQVLPDTPLYHETTGQAFHPKISFLGKPFLPCYKLISEELSARAGISG
jgi:hypothetical protein